MAREAATSGKLVGAVSNALTILRFIAGQSVPNGVNQIARATGISVSTCFNILRTLTSERIVNFDEDRKTYRLGLGLIELTTPLLGVSQADLISPELEKLSSLHKCLICLWLITSEDRVVLVNRVASHSALRVDMMPGLRLPVYAGAVGRCIAGLREETDRERRKKFDRVKWQTPPSYDEFMKTVLAARRDGFAYDFGQLFNGLDVAASVITDSMSKPRYGISGISIVNQMTREQIGEMALDLRNATDWISEALFGVRKGERQLVRNMAGDQQLRSAVNKKAARPRSRKSAPDAIKS